jgi:predicted lipoprotein with Yx(FWY)xxD motif
VTSPQVCEDLPQAVLTVLGADEQLSGDLTVGLPSGCQARDLRLLWGSLVWAAGNVADVTAATMSYESALQGTTVTAVRSYVGNVYPARRILMTRSPIYAAAAVAFAIVAAACGSYAAPSASTSTGGNAPANPYRGGTGTGAGTSATTVAVENSKLGQILVGGSGRTLYLFEADQGTMSTCNGACAQAWPPLTTSGPVQAGTGASAAQLGTTTRQDHTSQVTYNGHPLYYFVGDSKPGDVTGQSLDQFGARWYVLAPTGNKIDTN